MMPTRRAIRARRSRFLRRRILVVVGSLTALTLVGMAAFATMTYLRIVDNISDNVVARPGADPEPEKALEEELVIPQWDGPVNLLIMGSDTRVGLAGDYGDVGGARSDVMMLLHVGADRSNATLISIPRDTMLPIPECVYPDGSTAWAEDEAQINGALGVSPYCSLDAIRDFTGLPMEHFIVVDFDGVIGVTEAIGGVDVCVVDDIEDPYSGLFLSAGEHSVKGHDALAFLRTRHGFGDGSDLGRISAQQSFLSSLARKVKSAGTLSNPFALFSLADAASRSISVDEGLAGSQNLVSLAGTLAGIDLDKMVLIQLPVEAYWADDNRVQPIWDEAEMIFSALRDDIPLTFTDFEAETAETEAPAEADLPPTVALPEYLPGQTAAEVTCAR